MDEVGLDTVRRIEEHYLDRNEAGDTARHHIAWLDREFASQTTWARSRATNSTPPRRGPNWREEEAGEEIELTPPTEKTKFYPRTKIGSESSRSF